MATIPEIEARIHALWVKEDARTPDKAVELGQLLMSLETEVPPGDFYRHILHTWPRPPGSSSLLVSWSEVGESRGMISHYDS
jgi:hypothetical protein